MARRIQSQVKAAGCCGHLSARFVVLTFSVLSVALGITFGAATIGRVFLKDDKWTSVDLSIIGVAFALWICLAIVGAFGIYAGLRPRVSVLRILFLFLVIHWILDLGSNAAFLFISFDRYTKSVRQECSVGGDTAQCNAPVDVVLIIATCGILIFKALSAYICVVLFCYRRDLLAQENAPPAEEAPKSPSSVVKVLPYLYEEEKAISWPPRSLPVIKIDPGSDQSSGSEYSEDSARSQNFDFASKYPGLESPRRAWSAEPHVVVLPQFSVLGSSKGPLS